LKQLNYNIILYFVQYILLVSYNNLGDYMAIVKYTTKERDLLARLMRAEAVGEGDLGMLMVGNVGVNRTLADCLTFADVRTIEDMVYQNPGGFSGVNSPLFFSAPTTAQRNLADRVLNGEYYYPATNALWFYAPGVGKNCTSTWWDQTLSGKYKNHCFYIPDSGVCKQIH
jgi:N-acetylmuramoyl-L-alanine amidase